jgi:phosphoribosylanthranilate isomerase
MRIKICGITRSEDALLALQLGAWALGFIFYAKSPRYIEPTAVKKILDELQSRGLKPEHAVGVFVNASAHEIRQTVASSGIDTIQLHGDETADFCAELKDLHLWKAFRLQKAEQLLELPHYEKLVQALLFDAAVPGQFGGTGHTTDWNLVAGIRSPLPVILSGGLHPGNIKSALARVPAHAYDLSSGVESEPGMKDHTKLTTLFAIRSSAHDSES